MLEPRVNLGEICPPPPPSILTFVPTSADSPRNGSVPAKASPRASPSVAVDLHRLSRGILLALVEAGTPFQGHASVFMPDLRESDPRVLGATASDPELCWGGSLSQRSGPGALAQGWAWGHRHPATRILPSSAEDSLTTLCFRL